MTNEEYSKDGALQSIHTMTEEVAIKVTESIEEFIFETIYPFCNETTKWKVSKHDLAQALEQYYRKAEQYEDCISRTEAIKALEYNLSVEADGGLDKYRTVIKDLLNAIYNTQKKAIEDLPSVQPKYPSDMGEVSDGYHTFNQLYHQRAVLFATIVKQNKDKAWKSYKHADGKFCFDSNGEWFIVGVDTPQGSYTYHYSKEYWDMFDCKELETSKEWDGHTEEDVTRLLTL